MLGVGGGGSRKIKGGGGGWGGRRETAPPCGSETPAQDAAVTFDLAPQKHWPLPFSLLLGWEGDARR